MKGKKITFMTGFLLVLLLAAMALMGACGGGTTTTPTTPTPTTTPTTPTTPGGPTTITPTTTPTTPTTPNEPEKVYDLTLADYQGPTIKQAKWIDSWAAKMKEQSNGRLNIRVYHAQQLLPANNTWPGVAKGLADFGVSFRYETFGKVFTDYMGPFAGGCKTGAMSQAVFWDAYNKFPEVREEWTANKLLFGCCPPGFSIHNGVRPLQTPADIVGLQIRVSSAANGETLKAWGATPVHATIADAYSILQKGTAQGIHCGIDALMLFRFGELIGYTTWTFDTANNPSYLCMNWDTYNSLPADLQKIIDDSAPQASEEYQAIMDEGSTDAIEWLATLPNITHEYYTPTDAELAQWLDPLVPLRQAMAAEIDAKGYPGTAVYEYAQERVKYYISHDMYMPLASATQ